MWEALIGAASGFCVAVLGYFATRTRSLDSQREDFKVTSDLLMKQLTDLLSRVDKLEQQHDEDERRIAVLEEQHRADTKQHLRDVRRIDALAAYVRELLAFIRQHVPSPEPPPIPYEFSDDI
ncbi:hypothetical protein [Nocardia sp. CC227C]|uniref:hypothetical protein n=1 Tax=Nocardia sp. CC227C TaxID=3044562 RepID=UPI00278C1715|nr:hypothetical protein [Nocardia sp. CC227C]